MASERVMNRWIVVVGAVLIQLCLGAIYAWSVFSDRVTLPIEKGGQYGFTRTQAAWVLSSGLASFALVMVLAGRLQARIGPRPIAFAGAIVLGTGYILGGFLGSTFLAQLLCIGLIGGAGIGLAYVVPIAVGVKWFPDKKGMITGLVVAGFGFGATFWIKMADNPWPWFGGLLNTTSVCGLPGVQSVFVIYGVTFLICMLIGSVVMVNPPAGYKPPGWEPQQATAGKPTGAVELTAGQMLKTPQFYMIWTMFVCSSVAGLMVISCIKLFGIDSLQAHGAVEAVDGKTLAEAAGLVGGTAMAWYAILNGLGRIVWGIISDRIGRKASFVLILAIQGCVMLAFFRLGESAWGFIVGASLIGFNYGGTFALFPAATADYFGNKNVGVNYGWVFLAYGVAGIAGPGIAGHFSDAAKNAFVAAATDAERIAALSSWMTPFVIAGCGCFLAAVLAFMLKPPKHG